MAHSSTIKNFRDGTILLESNAGALNVTAQFEEGNFSASGLTAGQKEVAAYLDRGDLASLRSTNQTFPSGSFAVHFADLADPTGTYDTLMDAVNKTTGSLWVAAVSTLGANADVYTLKITLTIAGTVHGDSGGDHVVVLDDCHLTADLAEGDPSTFSFNFVCYGDITFT